MDFTLYFAFAGDENAACSIDIVRKKQYNYTRGTDSTGAVVARYSYDAWGVPTITQDLTDCGVAQINPFRYRGYYYDSETGLYYLQSRYYDPVVGRFLNEDELINLESTLGNNIFAYCENDSINYFDTDGVARNPIQHKYNPKEALKYAEEWWNK